VAVTVLFVASVGVLRAATADDLRALASRRLGLGAVDETATPRQ
jgi:hypothetical protein